MMRDRVLVIPCFNEERRLRRDELKALVAVPSLRLLLVDDGSTDRTGELLEQMRDELGSAYVSVRRLEQNRGKGEAVRVGMLQALAEGALVVGYADGDFATPSGEVVRMLAVLESNHHQAVIGSRVRRLGSKIDRSPRRHVLGRVFATLASSAIDCARLRHPMRCQVVPRGARIRGRASGALRLTLDLRRRAARPPPGPLR